MGQTPASGRVAFPAQTAPGSLPEPPSRSVPHPTHPATPVAMEGGVAIEGEVAIEGGDAWSGSAPPPSIDDPLVGTELSGTYRVHRIVGEGGMGRVYEAQHTRISGKRFAIKALHPEFARREDVVVRFHREVEAAAAIDSPHVVSVYDVGDTPDGRPFFVSELLEGQELGDHLDQRTRVPVAWAVHVIRQICRGLQAAHDSGVVHRDMKPENVFLVGDVADPVVKVLDFGISRLEGQGGNTLTKTGVVMGTPSYMAPEQAKGLRVDHRVDVYAVGAILYRAVTGCLPFERPDATATLAAVLTEEPEPPRSLVPDLPPHLELIIQRAMAREPDDRYPNLGELDAALAPFDQMEQGRPDATAKHARLALASTTHAERQAREVRDARPQLISLGVLATLAGLAGLLSLIAGLVRVTRDGKPLTGFEALVVLAIIAAALTTPLVLLVRHVRTTIWGNLARVIELLNQLRRPVLAGVLTYGAMALAIRTWEVMVTRHPYATSWAWWDLLLPLSSLAVAVAVMVGQRTKPGQASLFERAGPTPVLSVVGALAILVVGGAIGLRADLPRAGATTTSDEEAPTKDREKKRDRENDPEKSAGTPATAAAPKKEHRVEDVKLAAEAYLLAADQLRDGKLLGAVDSVAEMLKRDPDAAEDKNVKKFLIDFLVKACDGNGAACVPLFDAIQKGAGSSAPDVFFELVVTKGRTGAQRRASKRLEGASLRRQGTDAFRVAYGLRQAKGCGAVRKLLPEVEKAGDVRAKRELEIMKSKRQCPYRGCCLDQNDADVEQAIRNVDERSLR